MRLTPAGCAGSCICATGCPALRRSPSACSASAPERSLPRWHARPWRARAGGVPFGDDGRDVALLVDTFTTWFEPGIARAAAAVLAAAGYRVHLPAADGARPLCCGRTFLAVGLIGEARREAARMLAALAPLVERGLPVIGLEPSCLLTLRDEYLAMRPGPETEAVAARALLLEEFLWQEQTAGPAAAAAAARRAGAARCSTATAIRRRSMRWPRSKAACG